MIVLVAKRDDFAREHLGMIVAAQMAHVTIHALEDVAAVTNLAGLGLINVSSARKRYQRGPEKGQKRPFKLKTSLENRLVQAHKLDLGHTKVVGARA